MTCLCLQEDSIMDAKVVGDITSNHYSTICLEKSGKRYILITLINEYMHELRTYLFGFDCEHPVKLSGKPFVCCDERSILCEIVLDVARHCWKEEAKKA